ncbi:MAG: hypothetical protein ABUS51_05405 [Acidobacteriota bacterium]
MKQFRFMIPLLLAGYAWAQQATPAPVTATPAPPHTWTTEQAVTSTVREAWALGGKTPEGFFEIVKALTELSAQKRGVTIPDTEENGAKAGEWIKKQAKKDPDQLLYVIVDHAVQHSAAK